MSDWNSPANRFTRRSLLKGGAGLIIGASALGAFTTRAFAADQVLKIARPVFTMDWSPMAGGGHRFRWNSLYTRCPIAMDVCRTVAPAWRDTGAGHFVACHAVAGG